MEFIDLQGSHDAGYVVASDIYALYPLHFVNCTFTGNALAGSGSRSRQPQLVRGLPPWFQSCTFADNTVESRVFRAEPGAAAGDASGGQGDAAVSLLEAPRQVDPPDTGGFLSGADAFVVAAAEVRPRPVFCGNQSSDMAAIPPHCHKSRILQDQAV